MSGPTYPCPHCINGINNPTLGTMGLFRIQVTGWRFWPRRDAHIVHDRLYQVRALFPDRVMVVVDGMCPRGGVDDYANEWAREQDPDEVMPERHPGIYTAGRFWGPERNSHMVSLGFDYLLSFPESGIKQTGGTWDCTRKARAANPQSPYVITPYKD